MIRYLLPLLLLACDLEPIEGASGTDTADLPSQLCPTICDGTCPPACVPDPCGTIGDWCLVADGDQQCGARPADSTSPAIRMACVEGGGANMPGFGECAVPCSDLDPCPIGECDLVRGVCRLDGQLVPPIQCG